MMERQITSINIISQRQYRYKQTIKKLEKKYALALDNMDKVVLLGVILKK